MACSLRRLVLAGMAAMALLLLAPMAHAACTSPSGEAGHVIFNTTHKVMQYCNGTNWVNTGAAEASATQSGCTSPNGLPGEVIYAANLGVIQFCNGQNWVNTACADTRTPGGTGCTSPAGAPGDMQYASNHNELQFCDSTNWVAMGWPCKATGSVPVSVTLLTTATAGTNYIVPAGVTHLRITAWGAGGAGMVYSGWSPRYVGGGGGFAEGTVTVTPGETLSLRVGQGGPTGGGTTNNGAFRSTDGTASSGGGYTGVFRSTTPLLIAGAGGGGGTTTSNLPGGPGGGGGGVNGQTVTSGAVTVTGGTQSAGGTATGGSNTNSGAGGYLTSNGTTWTSGGSGYYGGASHYVGFGSGGSSYIDAATNAITVGATGQNAANNTHQDYMPGKAMGGNNSAGTDGILIVRAFTSEPVGTPPNLGIYWSCLDAYQKGETASGVYTIYPANAPSMAAYCDMTTDGGGWTLVLNYLHLGGTTPANVAVTNTLPLQGSTTLGGNESGTPYWGHTAPSMLSKLAPFTTVRFYCKTSNHARILHFKTTDANTISYFKTGSGQVGAWSSNYTALAGHNAVLPASGSPAYSNRANSAMTYFPYYVAASNHWAPSGEANRWECDDYTNNANYNTFHQIWVR